MAITLEFKWRGMTIPNAYIRLDEVRGGKRMVRQAPQQDATGMWQAAVGIYADKDAANEHPPILVLDVTIPFVTDEAPMPLLYAMLKTAPELAGAVDC